MTAYLYAALAAIAGLISAVLYGKERGAKRERDRQALETEKRNRNMATKLLVVEKEHRHQQAKTDAGLKEGKRDQMEDTW